MLGPWRLDPLGTMNLMRAGVDTGGTFTDCVVADGSEIRVIKVFSGSPASPEAASLAIVEGVAQLAEHYPMSFAAVQKHVAILERAGLVTKQRIGRRKVVRTNLEGLHVARRLLDRYEELWRGRVDRMSELLTTQE